eukprot:1156188-Pelagomonas_calceolata.AAC.4
MTSSNNIQTTAVTQTTGAAPATHLEPKCLRAVVDDEGVLQITPQHLRKPAKRCLRRAESEDQQGDACAGNVRRPAKPCLRWEESEDQQRKEDSEGSSKVAMEEGGAIPEVVMQGISKVAMMEGRRMVMTQGGSRIVMMDDLA